MAPITCNKWAHHQYRRK